jgi:putative oxidoreductase
MDATRYLPFVGRLLIGLPFTMSGLGKLAAYGKTTAMIAAAGLPVPPLAYAVAVALELGGGVLLVEGYQVRPIAAALAVFCIAAGVSFHSNFADQNQMIHFLKNVMMAGGCFRRSLRGRRHQSRQPLFQGARGYCRGGSRSLSRFDSADAEAGDADFIQDVETRRP